MSKKDEKNVEPTWLNNVLKTNWDSCIVLMRHEQRPDDNFNFSVDYPLTEEGMMNSLSIGEKLKHVDAKTTTFLSSRKKRCFDTAFYICKGTDLKKQIKTVDFLEGSTFYYDKKFFENECLEDRVDNAVLRYMEGYNRDGFRDPYIGSCMLAKSLMPYAAVDKSLTIAVTHDQYIAIFLGTIFKRFRSNNWMECGDGAIIVRNGESYEVIWRNQTRPLWRSIETKGEIDTSPE